MEKDVTALSDYTTLKKLASALWQKDSSFHGAAVMVGAGFSRCAASTGDISCKLPLWSDFARLLAKETGAGSNSDPLRLAEEYSAYFGKQSLHDLIKKEVNDVAWTPGELHTSLLELPWSEVLTTNWDTLLERASVGIHQPVYSVVSKQSDLASARSPRIVKLHGTINVTEELIFTQEDYRGYPGRHAAFVNFSRQVFIENELCLLGFSGDDPNFLQWAGWVRDHLAVHARRIYLVGALDLSAAKRKYLESINVAPIDLGELVSDYDDHDAKHLEATKIFLKVLNDLKPKLEWEWFPTPFDRSESLEFKLAVMRKDRESYPGWVICPMAVRWQLQTQLGDTNLVGSKAFSELSPDVRNVLLYEIAWRKNVIYEVIPSWLVEQMLQVCDPLQFCKGLTKKQQVEISLLLLKNTRWLDEEESKLIEGKIVPILEGSERYWSEGLDEVLYHKAVLARDEFDYLELEVLVNKISERNHLWKLRKASLLAELGKLDEAESLISDARRELLGCYKNNQNSIYILSRLVVASWLLHCIRGGEDFESLPRKYRDWKCDVWDHIEHIRKRILDSLEKQQEQQGIEPLFEPGHYRDKSKTRSYSSGTHPVLLLDGLLNGAGIPLRFDNCNLLADQASKLAELEEVGGKYRFALAIRAANSEDSISIAKVFARTQVACLSDNEVDYLLAQSRQAIDYWAGKCSKGQGRVKGIAVTRLRVFIEVLARVSVRATQDQAVDIFRFAIELGKKTEFQHVWLSDVLGHLIKYSMKSISTTRHCEILLDALSFPLKRETCLGEAGNWPNPIINSPGSDRTENRVLDRRIDEIIDLVSPCSPKSATALLRVLPLLKGGFLTGGEKNKLAEKIWGAAPVYELLPDTGLFKFVLFELPSLERDKVKALVRQYLFEEKSSYLYDPSFLMDVTNAALTKGVEEFPEERQAIDYFDRLVVWRPSRNSTESFFSSDGEEEQVGEWIGTTISWSVVPALSEGLLTEDRFKKLQAFYLDVKSPGAIIAFVYFAVARNSLSDQVGKIIRQGLRGQSSGLVSYSCQALLKWRELVDSAETNRLIVVLISLIGANRVTGLAMLLWTANQMYNKNYLSEGDVETLVEILPVVFENASYENISYSSQEAVTVSLVRAACVRFARDILKERANYMSELVCILNEAKQDALPEVRYAEQTDI